MVDTDDVQEDGQNCQNRSKARYCRYSRRRPDGVLGLFDAVCDVELLGGRSAAATAVESATGTITTSTPMRAGVVS